MLYSINYDCVRFPFCVLQNAKYFFLDKIFFPSKLSLVSKQILLTDVLFFSISKLNNIFVKKKNNCKTNEIISYFFSIID